MPRNDSTFHNDLWNELFTLSHILERMTQEQRNTEDIAPILAELHSIAQALLEGE